MCLAIPGKVREIEGSAARVIFGSVERIVQLDLTPDVQVGEYVLVHAGYAIQRLDAKEGEELLALFDEMEARLGSNADSDGQGAAG